MLMSAAGGITMNGIGSFEASEQSELTFYFSSTRLISAKPAPRALWSSAQ